MNPFRAQLGQTFVHFFARAAELGIILVAQREDGIGELRQLRRFGGSQ